MIKSKIKYLLYKISLRKTIPAEIINNVQIHENNETLINIKDNPLFFFGDKLNNQSFIMLRASVVQKLEKVAQSLPKDIFLKIYSAYRDKSLQTDMWQKHFIENQRKYPNLNEAEIEQITKSQIANPTRGFGGHQTGGAVDVSLCNNLGQDLDMGTKVSEHNKKTFTKNKDLNKEQLKNRSILIKAMERQGFKNYPGEWWHFAYGDRLWAAYSNKKQCFYGEIKNQGDFTLKNIKIEKSPII